MEVTITLNDCDAHSYIRALEDAGCQSYADTIREAANCTDPYCITPHTKEA